MSKILTLSVPYVELVYLLSVFVLFNGISAGNRKRETPFKVLHLVHGVEGQTLGQERKKRKNITNMAYRQIIR